MSSRIQTTRKRILIFRVLVALPLAVRQDKLELVQDLVNVYNVDVNVQNDEGNTPLHIAFCEGNWDIFKELVMHGADVKAKNNKGETPLETVCDFNIDFFYSKDSINIQHNSGLTVLHQCCDKGFVKGVKLFLSQNADPKIRNLDGNTPLHVAAKRGHLYITLLLLKYEAFRTDKETIGVENLSYAEVLMMHKVNVNAKNAEGKTALHLAYEEGHMDVVKLLKRYGADLDALKIGNNFNKLVKNVDRFTDEL